MYVSPRKIEYIRGFCDASGGGVTGMHACGSSKSGASGVGAGGLQVRA